ncbi:MAG: branched-chain amino acid ABC transporter substrate-binding protein, partial [Rhizobiaceae bacterium]
MRRWGTLLGLAAVAALFVVPLVASSFWTYLLSEVVIWAFVAVSFTLVYSYANILSFAQGSLFGFAAYAVAILNNRYGLPLAWAVPSAVVATVALGALLG